MNKIIPPPPPHQPNLQRNPQFVSLHLSSKSHHSDLIARGFMRLKLPAARTIANYSRIVSNKKNGRVFSCFLLHHLYHGSNGLAFSVSSDVTFWHLFFLYTSQSTISSVFDFKLLEQKGCTFFKNDRWKRRHCILGAFWLSSLAY